MTTPSQLDTALAAYKLASYAGRDHEECLRAVLEALAVGEAVCGACGQPWTGEKCGQTDNGWPYPVCYPTPPHPTPPSAVEGQGVEEEEDWREDPAADERWQAGCDFAMTQMCSVLGLNPKAQNWDAATETLDGDVCSVIAGLLEAALGENWQDRLVQPEPRADVDDLAQLAIGDPDGESL